ncbi:histidine phosphatase superfamily [Morchella snyderi]|nr:histidine phosphatase superfamily [Morchella snyderi]
MTTPRVFLARHGETEWTLNGRHTGITEIPLTPRGETQVRQAARCLVGPGRLIDPARLARVYVSPRVRAQRTLELLLPRVAVEVRSTEDVAEWRYGRYEGWVPARIREDRRARGLDAERPFDIWRDGCEDGESAAEVRGRLDAVIAEIRALQGPCVGGGGRGVDVLVVSHGHLLRAFTKRWLGLELDFPLQMILEPGGIATLTYNHHSIDEPAFLLGGVFKDPTADADADVGGAE